MALEFVFFLLPVFLSLGVAAQALGVYFCALLLPAVFWIARLRAARSNEQSFGSSSVPHFFAIGALLLALHAVFPLANLIRMILAPKGLIADAPLPEIGSMGQLFASRLSSAAFISGCFFVCLGFASARLTRRLCAEESQVGPIATDVPYKLFNSLLMGVGVSTSLLAIYLVIQSTTGFDFRVPGHLLAPEHRMMSGLYRVFGFYGHPLSVAGVSLCWFTFLWTFFWTFMQGTTWNRAGIYTQKILTKAWQIPALLLLIAFGQFLFIVLSGGRTALAVATVLFAIVPFASRLPPRIRMLRNVVLAAGAVGITIAIPFMGVGKRLQYTLDSIGQGGNDPRLTFWKVHFQIFLDHRWWGLGSAWMESGLRKEYYARMGYAALNKDFNAHNLFLETLSNVGIFGTALLISFLCILWRLLWIWSDKKPLSRATVKALFVAFLANLAHGFTENTYFVSNIFLVYLALLCFTVWLLSYERPSEQPTPSKN